jgi:hypothetical protein
MEAKFMSDRKATETVQRGNASQTKIQSADTSEMEERALSVFASERNEDLTALILCLITTFVVLAFTKWVA